MGYELDRAGVNRLDEYFEKRIGKHLRDRRKRESFAMYALGLVGDGERKSAEPIAARASADPARARAMHEKLLHFVGRSHWSDRAVRLEAARYAIEALGDKERITTWVIDDTGFLKQGTHSVGVQRQYTGSAGKIANCQLGVSLCVATPTEHVPIDFELYLPKSWTEDAVRRREARIPDDVVFKTKIELAIDMMRRASADGIAGELVLADCFYGRSSLFRMATRELGLDYAVAVDADTRVWLLDKAERRRGAPVRVDQMTANLPAGVFRRFTWREGSKAKMASRFCFRRVVPAPDDGTDPAERERIWLVAEWPEGEAKPNKFVFTTLPRRLSKKQIIRLLKERWRTERAYEDLKGELGLDHFEGRSFPGWHHHVSVVLCCYAFIVAERVRHFPPSRRGSHKADTHSIAA
jgi:SRSO17 transposase